MFAPLSDSRKVEKSGFTAWVNEASDDLNTVYVECHERHGRCYVKNSHRIYYVISGEGEFEVDGEIRKVKSTDTVIIKPEEPYDYWGKMKLFEANFPKPKVGDEISLES